MIVVVTLFWGIVPDKNHNLRLHKYKIDWFHPCGKGDQKIRFCKTEKPRRKTKLDFKTNMKQIGSGADIFRMEKGE